MTNQKMESEKILSLFQSIFEGKNPPALTWDTLPSNGHLQTWIYSKFRSELPEDIQKKAQQTYYKFALADMRRKTSMEMVKKILDHAGISFCFLKGAELAYHYYPDPVLRYSIDLDLLVKEEDAAKAFQLISAAGWIPEHDFHDLECKHLPELRRKNFCTVEIHKHLFKGTPDENQKLMALCHSNRLPPELMLAHLLYHAFYHHHWNNALKTVLDIGMIFRNATVDPEHFQNIAKEFHLEGLLEAVLASFPECYPAEWRSAFPADSLSERTIQAIRTLALEQDQLLGGIAYKESNFIANHAMSSSEKVIQEKLSKISPSMLGAIYHFSPRKVKILYPFLICHYLITRGFRYFRMRQKNILAHHSDLESIYREIGAILPDP